MWFGMTSEAGRVLGVVFGDVRGREGRLAWFWAWVWLVGLSGVGCTFANCIHCLF